MNHQATLVCVKGTVRVTCSCGDQLGQYPDRASARVAHHEHVYDAKLAEQIVAMRQHINRLHGH